MGLQINTNVNALNAYRNLTGTQGSMTTSLERLSSGLRINRAADDAAGLAISEKLRAQVNGLNQAQANAQDGVSLIQTAEGALNETHAILQRMRTLAVQASSDTNTKDDRAAIQLEIDALTKEISDTTDRTQFNGMKLLDGNFTNKALQIGANQQQTMSLSIDAMDTTGLGIGTTGASKLNAAKGFEFSAGDVTVSGKLPTGNFKLALNSTTSQTEIQTLSGERVGSLGGTATDSVLVFDNGSTISLKGATDKVAAADDTFSLSGQTVALTGAVPSAAKLEFVSPNIKAGVYTIPTGAAAGSAITDDKGNVVGQLKDTKTVEFTDGSKIVSNIDFTAGALTITDGAGASKVDLTSRLNAVSSLDAIDKAIGVVSSQRAKLGALQNRLDHTVKNLGVSAENLAASESRIRDTDMAKEMTNFTRSQILQQAGVSMLAQANQSSQSVLKLLG